MRAATAIAGMLAAAAIGAGATGWIMSTHAQAGEAPHADTDSELLAPVGDLAGAPVARVAMDAPNPLGDGPEVVADGQRLFVAMNCAGCHNYGGRGGMGPDLTDTQWDHGGTPAQIFRTIYEGRSKGMPAWGRALPPETIWKLAAYVHSLGGGVPPGKGQDDRRGDFPAERRDTLVHPLPAAVHAEGDNEAGDDAGSGDGNGGSGGETEGDSGAARAPDADAGPSTR